MYVYQAVHDATCEEERGKRAGNPASVCDRGRLYTSAHTIRNEVKILCFLFFWHQGGGLLFPGSRMIAHFFFFNSGSNPSHSPRFSDLGSVSLTSAVSMT